MRTTLRFPAPEVERFAAASGDRNPLHVDPAFARRTPFGQPVVHGALAALALLGRVPPEAQAALRHVRVAFPAPVLPDTDVEASVEPDARRPGGWRGTLHGRGKVLVRLEAWPGEEPAGEELLAAPDEPMRATPADREAADLVVGLEAGGRYATAPDLAALARTRDAGGVAPLLVQGLAWCSYVVGMEVPGLRSLLAGIRLSVAGGDAPAQARHHVRVAAADERTGLVRLEATLAGPGGARASAAIEAFGRPRPTAHAPLTAAATAPAEAGAVAVVGASRGFGAALALALLEAGHAVHGTYAHSSDAAAGVASAAGPLRERLTLHQADARDAAAMDAVAAQLGDGAEPLRGLVLNAAAPPLAQRLTAQSADDLAAYVADATRRTAVALGALLPVLAADGAWLVFVSSSALDAPPLEWPHYAAAKGALEGLAAWAAAARPDVRTVVLRAPKMRTDFTASPSGAVGAAAPRAVARWLIEQLPGLPGGLSVLTPPAGPA